jgi:hypothetical protein
MEMAHDDGAAYAKLTTFWNIPCEAKRKELTEKLGLTRARYTALFASGINKFFDALLIASDIDIEDLRYRHRSPTLSLCDDTVLYESRDLDM